MGSVIEIVWTDFALSLEHSLVSVLSVTNGREDVLLITIFRVSFITPVDDNGMEISYSSLNAEEEAPSVSPSPIFLRGVLTVSDGRDEDVLTISEASSSPIPVVDDNGMEISYSFSYAEEGSVSP